MAAATGASAALTDPLDPGDVTDLLNLRHSSLRVRATVSSAHASARPTARPHSPLPWPPPFLLVGCDDL